MSRRRNLSLTFNINGNATGSGDNGANYGRVSSTRASAKPKESIYELKEVMNYIKYEWPQVMKEDSNPIELAISLLDDSSVGLSHKLPEFEDISENTASALRKVVNDYHEIFNNSIGSYHYLLTSSKENQKDANDIKRMLESTTKEIHDNTDYLHDLNQTSMRYSEMIEILDAMDSLNSIPEKIEQAILEKKIHHVYDIINQGYSTAEKYNLWNLACMNSIKNYLEMQSNNLFDMIIDELTNELYLKTPVIIINDNELWELFNSTTSNSCSKLLNLKNFLLKLNNLEEFIYNSANLDLEEISETFNEMINEFKLNQLPKLFQNQQKSSMELNLIMDVVVSGDFKTFNYIYQLLNTLLKLNRLNPAIEILLQSNQQEFHGLLYRIIEDIKQNHLVELTKIKKFVHTNNNSGGNNINEFDFELNFEMELYNLNDYSIKVLKNLFASIFLKSLIVLQRQSLVHEIINMFNLSLNYDLHRVWNNIKTELSMIMLSYISKSLNPNYSETHPERGTMNQLFKFDNIKFDDSTLANFPNLLTNTDTGNPNNLDTKDKKASGKNQGGLDLESSNNLYIKSESFQSNLEVLVPVNVFNMRIILEFFLLFVSSSDKLFNNQSLHNSKEIANKSKQKPHNKLSIKFFEHFMRISFLPKLKDNFNTKFNEIIGVNDEDNVNGFKTNLIQVNTNQLVYQNAQEFKKFFLDICQILNTSLIYRPELNDLVLQYLQKFLSGYQEFYNLLIMGNNNLKLNYWLKIPALHELSKSIMVSDANETTGTDDLEDEENETGDEIKLQKLVDDEISVMLQDERYLDVAKDDLLDEDTVNELRNLIVTINWILGWLPRLCKESNYTYEVGAEIERLKYDWNFLENGKKNITDSSNNSPSFNGTGSDGDATESKGIASADGNIYLSLNNDNFLKFTQIISQFKMVKLNCLINLRYDLRLRANYYILSSYKYENWMLNNEPGNADQYIVRFNKEIFTLDTQFQDLLSTGEMYTILKGMSNYLNRILIHGTRIIKKINKFGIKKILINIFTVQQMLKNLQRNIIINFERASYYFNLFLINENQLLGKLQGFTKFEKVNLIRLLYSEKLADGMGSSLVTSKYNDLLSKVN